MENEISTDIEGYVSFDEAAKMFDIEKSGISKLLTRYHDVNRKYVFKAVYNGRMRKVITKKGLVVLANLRGSSGKNRKSDITAHFQKTKEKLAEKAIEKTSPNLEVLLKELVDNQKQLLERIKRLERNETPKELLPPTTEEEPAGVSYRALLNQRIRRYVGENSSATDYMEVWAVLYEEMYYRYRINIRKRAEKLGIKPIDVLCKEGLIEEAWKVACKKFKLKAEKNG